jgi:hypothetical protein
VLARRIGRPRVRQVEDPRDAKGRVPARIGELLLEGLKTTPQHVRLGRGEPTREALQARLIRPVQVDLYRLSHDGSFPGSPIGGHES